jgi:hypothetical protein
LTNDGAGPSPTQCYELQDEVNGLGSGRVGEDGAVVEMNSRFHCTCTIAGGVGQSWSEEVVAFHKMGTAQMSRRRPAAGVKKCRSLEFWDPLRMRFTLDKETTGVALTARIGLISWALYAESAAELLRPIGIMRRPVITPAEETLLPADDEELRLREEQIARVG